MIPKGILQYASHWITQNYDKFKSNSWSEWHLATAVTVCITSEKTINSSDGISDDLCEESRLFRSHPPFCPKIAYNYESLEWGSATLMIIWYVCINMKLPFDRVTVMSRKQKNEGSRTLKDCPYCIYDDLISRRDVGWLKTSRICSECLQSSL